MQELGVRTIGGLAGAFIGFVLSVVLAVPFLVYVLRNPDPIDPGIELAVPVEMWCCFAGCTIPLGFLVGFASAVLVVEWIDEPLPGDHPETQSVHSPQATQGGSRSVGHETD